MKKLFLSFVMMLMASIAAWAQYVEQDGLWFSLHDTDPKYAQVEEPESGSYSGEINIPSVVSYGGEDYTVTYIGWNAFKESAVTKVTIPSSVTHILGSAFQGCASLTEVNLSEGLEDISSYAFQGSAVTSLTIPGTVTRIQSYAMEGMASLTKLTFAYGTEELALDWTVLNGTNNVTELVIDRYYTFGNGNGISYSTVKKVTFGEHLTTIPKSVCQGMELNELNVGANVTAVDSYAFSSCTLPEGCNFPFAQIKEIKDGAFYLTKNLPANLDLTGVETLATMAFANCELQSVILPMTVTSIGYGAFSYVENVKVYAPWLTSPASLANPDSPDNANQQFYFDKATLYVPAGTMDTYKSLVGWKEFETIDYWSFNVSATVAGKGSLKMSNGEAVHANGTNTEKTVTGTQLVEAGAGTPVSGLFVREKDVTFTATPARGYELSTLTANTADIKAASKVANLLADQNIAAQFTPIIYNITYNNLQNGVVDPANPTTYTVEDAAITLVNPTRTAYIFKGWTGTDLTEPTMNVTIPASSIGDREFTATWEPIVYDITYDLAGGAVDPANLDKYTIETADFTLTNPTKLGYTFLGWEGTDLTEKTMAVTVTTGHWGDRSYTATWEPNPYKVRFDINGTETMADQDHVYDAPLNLTQNAFTRTGYTFKEWNSKADGTGTVYADKAEVLNLTAVRDEVVTIYAQWTPNPYQVRFNTNNGTGSMDNEDFVYDTAKNLTENVFTRRGYTFQGWNTKADGNGDSYADKASVKNLTAELNGVVDLYAQWQIITYTISYDLAGGSVATANPTEYTIESEAITLVNPTREGYEFAGWTGTGLSAATENVTIAKGSYGDRTYTATWTPIVYDISYDLADGSVATANPTTYTIETPTFTLNNPTKAHYVFTGWTGTGLSAATQTVTIATGNTGNRSYTANWERETYTVTITSTASGMVTASTTSPKYEDDVVLTIGTDEDLDLISLTVDGVDVTAQISGGKYTIQNVSANVSVVATFNANKAFITMEHSQQTFSCPQALDFTGTGLKAYIASGFNNGMVLLTQVDVVPANTGLFIVGTEGLQYKVPFTTENAFYSNLLKPVTTAQVIPTTEGAYTNYLYGEVNGVKGFYKSSGSGQVAAGKAYLQLPTSAMSGARVSMTFEDEATGISSIVTFSNSTVYDLNGRKVADAFNPKRLPAGVYIVNGKKMVVNK